MSIALRKRPATGVSTPSPNHVAFFVDENGSPSLKDSNGNVTPATSTKSLWQPTVSGAGTFPLAVGKVNKYDSSGGSQIMTLQLPASPEEGDEVELKEVGNSSNSVALDGQGNDIEPLDLSAARLYVRYKWDSDGAIWRIVSWGNMA